MIFEETKPKDLIPLNLRPLVLRHFFCTKVIDLNEQLLNITSSTNVCVQNHCDFAKIAKTDAIFNSKQTFPLSQYRRSWGLSTTSNLLLHY